MSSPFTKNNCCLLSHLLIHFGDKLTSIKGHNSTTNVRKMMCNNPNLDLRIQTLIKFYQFVLKILSENEIVTDGR